MTSKADRQRYDRLQRIGCIVSRKLGMGWVPADMHHIVDKGYRRLSGGNRATIPLSPWFHRGQPPPGLTVDQATKILGPSLALNKREFTARFGSERELLAEVDQLIRI